MTGRPAPVRVVEGQSLCVREEQRVRVRASQAHGHKVCAEPLGELNWNRNRSPPGGGLGGPIIPIPPTSLETCSAIVTEHKSSRQDLTR